MWLARSTPVFWCTEPRLEEGDLQHLVPQIAALTAFAADLDGKLAVAGVGGLEGALTLHQRLRGVLDGVSGADLTRMSAQVHALRDQLVEVERRLAVLRELKGILVRVAEPG